MAKPGSKSPLSTSKSPTLQTTYVFGPRAAANLPLKDLPLCERVHRSPLNRLALRGSLVDRDFISSSKGRG
eukprot:6834952-Heterocapsa_arctica.AAC.1